MAGRGGGERNQGVGRGLPNFFLGLLGKLFLTNIISITEYKLYNVSLGQLCESVFY